jgi:cell division protein FtsQ
MEKKRLRPNRLKKNRDAARTRLRLRMVWTLRSIAAVAGLILISLVFIFTYDVFTQVDYFKARSLKVTGNRRLSDQQVIEQAAIGKQANILALNLPQVRKRLLAHPWIAEAQVARVVPSEIRIRVTEYEPLAIVELDQPYYANREGILFKVLEPSDPLDLPLVTGLTLADIPLGRYPASAQFEAAIQILENCQTPDAILPGLSLERIHVDGDIGLTLFAKDPQRQIQLGFGSYPQKWKTLKLILTQLTGRIAFSQLSAIDLNDLDRIVVTPSSSEVSDKQAKEVQRAGTG